MSSPFFPPLYNNDEKGLLTMEQAGLEQEGKKIVNWRNVARMTFSPSGIWQFTKACAPQIFIIWMSIAVLLEIPAFIEFFDWFRRHFDSPLFTLTSVGAGQPVDLTPFFLVGIGALLWTTVVAILLAGCIKICFRRGKDRPAKLERTLARFSRKMGNEVSSCLGHCSAATAVLLVVGHPERYGEAVVHVCILAALVMYILAGMGYRKD
ncbi:hypothetical protein [Burkholderia sp. BCC1988]|uniref:hypothetical protein n=1 Tax=Burkholderia sp. BCC1988 TaxID=2817443 RepID=UPI002AB1090E|nr:hypothetical protein [Burkholderia sp. BCC1988]